MKTEDSVLIKLIEDMIKNSTEDTFTFPDGIHMSFFNVDAVEASKYWTNEVLSFYKNNKVWIESEQLKEKETLYKD